jgi:hypothetical protein
MRKELNRRNAKNESGLIHVIRELRSVPRNRDQSGRCDSEKNSADFRFLFPSPTSPLRSNDWKNAEGSSVRIFDHRRTRVDTLPKADLPRNPASQPVLERLISSVELAESNSTIKVVANIRTRTRKISASLSSTCRNYSTIHS